VDRTPVWLDDRELRLGGTEFYATAFGACESTVDRFYLMKPRDLVERYVTLVAELGPRRIFELGIFRGGSTAFLSHLADPERLVAVELSDERVAALDQFVAQHGYGDRVRAHYGVNQADRTAIDRIRSEEFGDGLLDLVLDDASHQRDETRASFNTLFPYVRPGGLYVIEDWAWGLFAFSGPRKGRSLAPLVFELLLSLPYAEGMIDDITVDKYWAVVRRGGAPLVPAAFDLASKISERGRRMITEE
jgi:hypothetical protein